MTHNMAVDHRNIVMCNNCLDVIESVHRHDFKYCSCESVFVDGGRDYQRVGYKNKADLFIVDSPYQGQYRRLGDFTIRTQYLRNEGYMLRVDQDDRRAAVFMEVLDTAEEAEEAFDGLVARLEADGRILA